ncbi:MAG: cupin domain-containing protein [Candidatus Handelsmanbacteria bacterium]|nr:cupin domain-containing protein [Candidatus Handelsmanbacteria bacterium]
MEQEYCVRDGFGLPAEFHSHPGGVSQVVLGPGARTSTRPAALDAERLIIHTNEYGPDGTSGEAHSHADQEQAFYILEGRMEVWVGEQHYLAGPGDCVFLPRGVPHHHRNAWEGPLKFLFLSAMLGG